MDSLVRTEAAADEQNKGGKAQEIPSRKKVWNDDFETLNYPSAGDSTSSGGYASPTNVWSNRAQRGNTLNVGSYQEEPGDPPTDDARQGNWMYEKRRGRRPSKDPNTRDAKEAGDLLNPTFDNEDDGEM